MTQSAKFRARYSLYDRIGIRIEGDPVNQQWEWSELQREADTLPPEEDSRPIVAVALVVICWALVGLGYLVIKHL